MESDAMQSIPTQMAASPEALALATEILAGHGTMTAAIEQVGGLLSGLDGVDLVATTLVLLRPADTEQWIPLGERAWLREWRRPGAHCSVAPQEGGGPEQALTMPWLSPRARSSVIAVVDVERLPEEAAQDRRELTGCGVRAVVSQSISHHGVLYGSVAMAREEAGPWPESHLSDVRLLSAAVASRMAEELAQLALIDAIRRGDDAHRSKEHFFAALGHELRTPIAAILGTAELLGEDARERVETDGSGFAADVARDAGVVLRAAEQLHAVVEELLGTGQELGGGTETQWVDVAEALADVGHWLAAPARAGAITVSTDVAPGVLVRTTPSALRQILTNLLGNAIAYNSPGGSVHVTASRAIDEFGRPRVRIGVRDDGPGLTPEQQRQVFDPFVRFAGAEVRGTGLGLSLSRSLAERDGGLMGVESTPAEGSVFWLDLASS
ncbi:sensor histidine kinase [Nocardioides lianchengensis]|nr:HAMP domain-containing sensor histidine kinase [Nocardioides lianchengensis]NYG09884.1 signal transduction histidine kinase [Nocardioides lianchengensis]